MKNERLLWPIAGLIALAIMGLLGYLPGMRLLGSIREDFIPMAPSTAVCFLILGANLISLDFKQISQTTFVILLLTTLCVALFGMLEVAEYFTGKDLNFENRIVPDAGTLHGIPIARMSPATGTAFLLSGTAVFILIHQKRSSDNGKLFDLIVILLGLITLLIGFIFCLAYLYGVPLLYERSTAIPMALTTATSFLLIAVIILAFKEDAFLPQLFIGTSTRSYLLRFFLPLTTFSIILGGITVLTAAHTLKANPALITATLTVFIAIITGLVATTLSRHMGNKIDQSKQEILKANEALQKSEIRFRNIFSQTFQFTGIVLLDGTLTAANKNSLDFIGAQEADVIGQAFWDTPWWTHNEGLRLWLKSAINRAAVGETVQHEVTHCSSSGDIHYFDFSLKPIVDDSGKTLYLIPESRDITERKYAEEELRSKENEQREILNFMLDAVISIDQTGIILTFNKAAESLFGYSSNEIIGQTINQLMPEKYASEHDAYMQHFIDTNEPHIIGTGREVEGLRKNGEIFPIHISVTELPSNDNGNRRFIGSCHDLTEYKQKEEHIRRVQKMDALGKLTGGIAHDYNNMLGVVIGYANLLEDALDNQPKLAKYAHAIVHAGDRGAKLTRKLLAFSRHIASDEELHNINALLREQQHMLEKTLTARIKLVFELADNLWPVWIDDADLEDAVLNMSINAMHAMETGGQLTVRTCNKTLSQSDADTLKLSKGDYVELDLIDTGCGMDEKTRENIFKPFFSTKGDKGTGLGLSQVHSFVERCGGVINISSIQGKGTQFELYFPRHIDSTKNIIKNVKSTSDLTGNESILIVDDEPALLFLTSETLKQQGYNVICAENAKQALDILEHESIDLFFTDVIMPDMDGYELAALVQKKYPTIKIQLATGFNNSSHENTAENSLYKDLLYKPFDTQLLLQKIRESLDK